MDVMHAGVNMADVRAYGLDDLLCPDFSISNLVFADFSCAISASLEEIAAFSAASRFPTWLDCANGQ